MIVRIFALAIVACGPQGSNVQPDPLPPNIEQACDRAIQCGVFTSEERASCVGCLEHLSPEAREWIDAQGLPPFEQVDCETVLAAAQQIHLTKCVSARWYGR